MTTATRECCFEGCNRDRIAHGLCSGHAQQRAKGKELKPLRVRRMKPSGCNVDTCTETARVYTSGQPLCSKHHQRWLYHGDAAKSTRDQVRPRALAAIADAVANRNRGGCWTDWADLPCWEGLDGYGGTLTRGYPTIGMDKAMWFVMEADGRPRPAAPGNRGLHSCDTPACWNPDHLRWGTQSENAMDMQVQRNYCQHCDHCNP